jgi:hypothetical protein
MLSALGFRHAALRRARRAYCPGHLTDILAIPNFEAEIAAWDEHWQRRTIEPGIRINRPDDNHEMHRFKSAGLAQWMPATE